MAITSENFNPATNTQTTNVTVTAQPDPPFDTIDAAPTTSMISTPVLPAVNNLSDASLTGNLPIRAEKRFIPSSIDLNVIQAVFINASATTDARGNSVMTSHQITNRDFFVTGANKNLTDYVKIRIPHRGVIPTTGVFDPTQDAEFTFLINPKTIEVSKQTVDTQAVTRGGWQFGVWGEDVSSIRISGQTAGSYFALGLTDEFKFYAESYRNLMQLLQVYENNGYWFEGEEFNEGPLATDFLRRRIRMHQDIDLWVGNFIWSGMFESMGISQNADNPFLIDFELTFIAWKERYRDSSGYWDSKHNNIQRGHSYPAVMGTTGQSTVNNTLSQQTVPSTASTTAAATSNLANNPYADSPSVVASTNDELNPFTNPLASTSQGQMQYIFAPTSYVYP